MPCQIRYKPCWISYSKCQNRYQLYGSYQNIRLISPFTAIITRYKACPGECHKEGEVTYTALLVIDIEGRVSSQWTARVLECHLGGGKEARDGEE